MIDLQGLEFFLESIRWLGVAAVRRAAQGDPRPDIALGIISHACIVTWDDTSREIMDQLYGDTGELLRPSPLTMVELIRLIGTAEFPPLSHPDAFPLWLSDDRLEWVESICTDGVLMAGDTSSEDLVRWGLFILLKCYIHDDYALWEGRLASGEGDIESTYQALCDCLVSGVALAQHKIPSWLPEDDLTAVVRASWEGKTQFRRVTHKKMCDAGLLPTHATKRGETIPVELPNGAGVLLISSSEQASGARRVIDVRHALALEEMRRRGWGDDPSTLTLEQTVDVGKAVRDDPRWYEARKGNGT